MKRMRMVTVCLSVVLLLAHVPGASAKDTGGDWKSFDVTYEMDPDYKNGPSMNWKGRKIARFEERTSKIWIPADMEKGETIRGVMPKGIRGLGEFAHRNRIALFDGGANAPYGCVNKTFLKAAAKVTGHPELEHAGAIQQGLSNGGRFEAHAAHFWPEKVIAVILDHSWCGGPTMKASGYNYGILPVAEGIPFFFNASQKDKFQGFDRRALHYRWCESAFNGKAKQPCTSVISYEDVGHGNCGTRALQAIWLEEVLALRVPVYIDPDGAPYKLKPIDVNRVGGHVVATLSTFEGRSIHTDVQVGPVGFMKKDVSWWIPGPRSASEMLEWVRKNGGKVALDGSSFIKTPSLFESSDGKLRSVCASLSAEKFGAARRSIETLLSACREDKEEDRRRIAELRVYRQWIDDRVSGHLAQLEAIKSTGDLQHLSDLLGTKKNQFMGIAAYDDACKTHRALLREKDSLDNLMEGRQFYSLIKKIERYRSKSSLKSLQNFAEKYPDRIYGRMAARISEELAKDLNASIDLDALRR